MPENINSTLDTPSLRAIEFPKKSRITPSSTILSVGNNLSCNILEEAVILDMNAGIYMGLNPVAARIWELIKEPVKVGEVKKMLLDEYEVDPQECERDLLVLLEQLLDKGLVEIRGS